jgi:nicotinamidase-related amidase
LLAHFRRAHWPVIHIQHLAVRPGATFFLPGTPGADFNPNVQPLPDETIVQKNFPNSFRDTPLLDVLRETQVSRLVICGMQTNMCVDASRARQPITASSASSQRMPAPRGISPLMDTWFPLSRCITPSWPR